MENYEEVQWRLRQLVRSKCHVAIDMGRSCTGGECLGNLFPSRPNRRGSQPCTGNYFKECSDAIDMQVEMIKGMESNHQNAVKSIEEQCEKRVSELQQKIKELKEVPIRSSKAQKKTPIIVVQPKKDSSNA